jgi:integrase
MEEGCFELGIYDTKTGEPRNVYFRGNPILNEIVERRMRVRAIHHNFLFTNRDGNPIEALDTAWFWACKRAGIEDLIFHDLRHAFATYGRRAGIPESVLMKMGGWKTRSVFERYHITDDQDVRKATEAMGALQPVELAAVEGGAA